MSDQLYTLLLAIVSAIFGGGLSWIFTVRSIRRKAANEATGGELDNVDKAVRIWRELSTELRAEIEKLKIEIANIKPLACYRADCTNRQAVKPAEK